MTLKKLIKALIILPFLLTFNAYGQSAVQEKMSVLSSFIGEWDVSQFTYTANEKWEKSSTSRIDFKSSLSAMVISGETRDMMPSNAMNLQLTFTYDQFRKTYRLSVIDSLYGLMDIYEGNMNVGDDLVLTNLNSDTNFPVENGVMHFRFTFKDDDADKKSFSIEQTSTRGEKWGPMLNYIMTKNDVIYK